MRRLPFLAVLAFLLVPASASAATPITIGAGSVPGLAVDNAGTAYIAYNGANSTLQFCRLPRGATTCAGAPNITIPAGSQSLYRPFVSVSGPTVQIVQSRYGFAGPDNFQTILFTSTNGGDSFGAGREISNFPTYVNEGVFGTDGTFTGASNAYTSGGAVQSMALAAGTATTFANLFPAGPFGNGAVGLTPSGQRVAVFENNGDAQFRLQNPSTSTPNDVNTWGAPTAIGYASYPRFAGGPLGLFMLDGTVGRGIEVRQWTGTLGPGTQIAPDNTGGEVPQAALTQDPGGRLHAVWPEFEADGIHLIHAVSDNGSSFSQGTLLIQPGAEEESSLRVGAAPDHIGVAVWETQTQIRVAPLGPNAPVDPPAPPAPPATPAPTPAPAPVFNKTVVVRPISGIVLVKLKGSKTFVPLSAVSSVPLGSTLDTKNGRVQLSSLASAKAAPQAIQLYDGQFAVTQSGKVTQFTLSEALAPCGKGAKAAAKKPKTRRLWGDGSGSFRTRGHYSAATVRGTTWLTQDSCAGTLTKVTRGVVAVRDNVRHKTIVLRAGHRYQARPRR